MGTRGVEKYYGSNADRTVRIILGKRCRECGSSRFAICLSAHLSVCPSIYLSMHPRHSHDHQHLEDLPGCRTRQLEAPLGAIRYQGRAAAATCLDATPTPGATIL